MRYQEEEEEGGEKAPAPPRRRGVADMQPEGDRHQQRPTPKHLMPRPPAPGQIPQPRWSQPHEAAGNRGAALGFEMVRADPTAAGRSGKDRDFLDLISQWGGEEERGAAAGGRFPALWM